MYTSSQHLSSCLIKIGFLDHHLHLLLSFSLISKSQQIATLLHILIHVRLISFCFTHSLCHSQIYFQRITMIRFDLTQTYIANHRINIVTQSLLHRRRLYTFYIGTEITGSFHLNSTHAHSSRPSSPPSAPPSCATPQGNICGRNKSNN